MKRVKKAIAHYSHATAIANVEAIYEELTKRPLERHCSLKTGCCHFLQTGKTPFLTEGEALVALKALRRSGRKKIPKRNDGACRFLHPTTARCLIYEGRPFGCRTHFCQAAGGPYPRRDVIDLIHRLEEIDRRLQGDGAKILDHAIESALTRLPSS